MSIKLKASEVLGPCPRSPRPRRGHPSKNARRACARRQARYHRVWARIKNAKWLMGAVDSNQRQSTVLARAVHGGLVPAEVAMLEKCRAEAQAL